MAREKTVTYRQLFANKLQLQAMLSYYQTYGLVDEKNNKRTIKCIEINALAQGGKLDA